MRSRAVIIGVGLIGLALNALAYTSPYSSMAVAGSQFASGFWSATPNMTLVADNTWVSTQTVTAASGAFKFAANGSWTTNWGGPASIARVPAIASAPNQGGSDLTYSGLSSGLYRFTFNDSNKEFRMEWVGASPLPLPVYTNMALVGDFNGWVSSPNSLLTNSPANTNLWSGLINLETSTAFQFQPNGNPSNQWGAPQSAEVTVPLTNGNACGKSDFTLLGFEPGTFLFTLNTSNATFTISQVATQSFSTMTVQGDFIATNNPPPNMMRLGSTTTWESDHFITNSGSITLRFSGNRGVRLWGATNTFAQPANGTLMPAQTNFVTLTSIVPGRYRITFDHVTGEFNFQMLYTEVSGINLLKNSGFEQTTQEDGGDAKDWTGSQAWPKRVVDGYAPHSGNWCGAIHGKLFPSWNDYGSFSQDVLVTSGKTYRASAWLKATTNWTASSMQIKIEWQNAATNPVGDETVENILSLSTNWVKYSAEGVAPSGATRAHVVFLCAGAGTTGTMHVDDPEVRLVAGRVQNFDTWGSLTNFMAFAPDWAITSGRTVLNIPPGRPTAGVFISQYVEGTGNNKAIEIFNGTLSNLDLSASSYVLQQYDNGSLTASVTMALSGTLQPGACQVVARPNFPSNYAPDLAISALPNLSTNKYLTFNGDDVIVLRKGSNVVDRVGQVGTNATGSIWSRNTKEHTLTRKQNVFTGTLTSVTSPFSMDTWDISANDTFDGLGTHDISYIDPNEPYTPAGYSLIMSNNAILTSGDMPGGVGDISFWYRTESMSPPVTMEIETSPTGLAGSWASAATLSNIAASNFAYYVVAINRADHLYMRIRQTDGGTNRFRIDEITVTEASTLKRLEDFNGWTDPSFAIPGNYARYGWSLQNASIATGGVLGTRGALLSPPSSYVTSPTYEGGVGEVRFWAKANDSGSTALLQLETSLNGSNWVSQASFSATTGKTFSTWLYITNVGAQARLTVASDSGDALVDNFEIRLPALYRNQNFDGWPTSSGYITNSYQGWSILNCIVDAQNAYDGQVARFNTTIGNYVQSPELPDGIGTLSFRTRKWAASDATPTLQVQLSSNGANWITMASVTPASTNYESFTTFLLDTSNRFVRFYHSAASSRILLDDIRIGTPQPRPQVVVTPGMNPPNPLLSEPIKLTADVVTRYGASILSVTGYYSIANGSTNALPMAALSYGSYQTVTTIPGQSPSTQIRYFVTVQYAGVGAATNSSVYSTNQTTSTVKTNFVSTIPKGNVWVNEIFYSSYGDEPLEYLDEDPWFAYVGCNHEYIELCGRSGSDISGWAIQLAFGSDIDITANGGNPVYATYKIPTNTVFTNQTNGFSFYVLGDQELSTNHPIDKVLTTLVPTNVTQYPSLFKDHIHDGVGVIRVLNQFSNEVYALSYGGYANGADFIHQSQLSFGETNSIGLAGSNYTYTGFAWSMSNLTIGVANVGQTLVYPPSGTNIYAFGWHTQLQKITPANTNLVPAFYMLDPLNPLHSTTNDIYYGYTNASYPNASGVLRHRRGGVGASWNLVTMNIRVGSSDAAGHAYVVGRIPDHTYKRLQTMEYIIEVNPNQSGITTSYLASDVGNQNISTIYTNLTAAEAHPFTYLVPFSDQIVITNFVVGTTNILLQTEGNDYQDPITNFYVQYTTNVLTQYRYLYDGTNIVGLTPNPTWGTWINTNFTRSVDIYGQSTFNVKKAPTNWPKIFYRTVSRWP